MKVFKLLVSVLLLVGFVSCQTENKVEVKVSEFNNRPNAIELTNGVVELVVMPDIARIVYYGFVGESNLLYLTDDFTDLQLKPADEYVDQGIKNPHFGGDRVLTTSQDYFHLFTGSRFIADPWLTSSPYKYELLEDGVVITSPISKLLGVQLKRKITIEKTGTRINIEHELFKIQPAKTTDVDTIPLTIWNLTQVKSPVKSWLPLSKRSVFERGFDIPFWPDAKNWAEGNFELKDGLLEFYPNIDHNQKVGADARGWVAGLIKDVLMVERFVPLGDVTYPDGGTSATIFTSPKMAELETLSPEKVMQVGDTIKHSISWELIKVEESSVYKELKKL